MGVIFGMTMLMFMITVVAMRMYMTVRLIAKGLMQAPYKIRKTESDKQPSGDRTTECFKCPQLQDLYPDKNADNAKSD